MLPLAYERTIRNTWTSLAAPAKAKFSRQHVQHEISTIVDDFKCCVIVLLLVLERRRFLFFYYKIVFNNFRSRVLMFEIWTKFQVVLCFANFIWNETLSIFCRSLYYLLVTFSSFFYSILFSFFCVFNRSFLGERNNQEVDDDERTKNRIESFNCENTSTPVFFSSLVVLSSTSKTKQWLTVNKNTTLIQSNL